MFVGIGLLDGEDRVRDFVSRHKLTFPNIYDGNGRIARDYGFSRQPFYALVDRAGRLVHKGFGPTDEAAFVRQIESLLR